MSSASSISSMGAQQRGSRSPPTTVSREGTPESLVYADQKTKKRIQNRVAQRTYRNRMKQRVQDLEQQLCKMRTRQQQQQQFPQDMSSNVISDGSMCFVANASNMPRAVWQQDTPLPRTPNSLQREVRHGMAVDGNSQAIAESVSMATNTYMTRGFPQQAHYNNPAHLNQLNPTATAGLDHVRNVLMSPGQEMTSEQAGDQFHVHVHAVHFIEVDGPCVNSINSISLQDGGLSIHVRCFNVDNALKSVDL